MDSAMVKSRNYYFYFSEVGDEFFLQLTAEGLIRKKDQFGRTGFVYKQNRDRNEALDCCVYAIAAYNHRKAEFEPYLEREDK